MAHQVWFDSRRPPAVGTCAFLFSYDHSLCSLVNNVPFFMYIFVYFASYMLDLAKVRFAFPFSLTTVPGQGTSPPLPPPPPLFFSIPSALDQMFDQLSSCSTPNDPKGATPRGTTTNNQILQFIASISQEMIPSPQPMA